MKNKIAVVGFGKIGQAVAAHALNCGKEVQAIDINPNLEKVFTEKNFTSNEPGVEKTLVESFFKGTLRISTDFSRLSDTSAVLVCIPLLVSAEREVLAGPFLECIDEVGKHINNKCVVSIETSIPLGFSRLAILPLLQKRKRLGQDFFLVHSPERIKSGTMLQQLNENLKIVGGIDRDSTEAGMLVYSALFGSKLLRSVSSIEVAEMIKLSGMVYRDINIAISNQLSTLCQKLNIPLGEIIELANTDGEANLLQPGIGVGGHCTPVYPYFLIKNFKEQGLDFSLAQQARSINDGMAFYSAKLCAERGIKSVIVLGLGFRPNVKEDTLSTTYLFVDACKKLGIKTWVHDSLYSEKELSEKGFNPCRDLYATQADALCLVTHHRVYHHLDLNRIKKMGIKLFLDGRNALNPSDFVAQGIEYLGIGG